MGKIDFVARHSKQGDAIQIIVPVDYKEHVRQMKNPLKITIEEVFP